MNVNNVVYYHIVEKASPGGENEARGTPGKGIVANLRRGGRA